jgi:hypothetical protein
MPLTVNKNNDWTEVNVTLNTPAASETSSGAVKLASSSEVIAGTDTAKAVTAAGVAAAIANIPSASEGTRGLLKLASITDAKSGTDTTKAVTSAGVSAAIAAIPKASEGIYGLVKLATIAEVTAGTDKLKAATSAGVKAAIAALDAKYSALQQDNEDYWLIYNLTDLKTIAKSKGTLTSSNTIKIKLMGDIILDSTWTPWTNFYGTFDGNGKAFIIKNGVTLTTLETVIAESNYGLIINCEFINNGTMRYTSSSVGGFTSNNASTSSLIINCKVKNNGIINSTYNAGGIVAASNAGGIYGCSVINTGTISATAASGAIAGVNNTGTISMCEVNNNDGNISGATSALILGGRNTGTISNCILYTDGVLSRTTSSNSNVYGSSNGGTLSGNTERNRINDAQTNVIYKASSAPSDTGKIWINTSNRSLNYYNGTSWVSIVGVYTA